MVGKANAHAILNGANRFERIEPQKEGSYMAGRNKKDVLPASGLQSGLCIRDRIFLNRVSPRRLFIIRCNKQPTGTYSVSAIDIFRNSVGESPFIFLNARLKEEILVKPHSKAMSMIF